MITRVIALAVAVLIGFSGKSKAVASKPKPVMWAIGLPTSSDPVTSQIS